MRLLSASLCVHIISSDGIFAVPFVPLLDVLQVRHCTQNHVVVVARHRFQLFLAREVFDYFQVGVDSLHPTSHDDVRED